MGATFPFAACYFENCCSGDHRPLLVVGSLAAPGAVECIGAPKFEPISTVGTFLHCYTAPQCARGTRHHERSQGLGARHEAASVRDPFDFREAAFVRRCELS